MRCKYQNVGKLETAMNYTVYIYIYIYICVCIFVEFYKNIGRGWMSLYWYNQEKKDCIDLHSILEQIHLWLCLEAWKISPMPIWTCCMVCPHAWKVWTKLHKVKKNTIQITLMWLNMVCFQHNVVIYWLQHLETDKLYILKISLFQKTQLVSRLLLSRRNLHSLSLAALKSKEKKNRIWAILFCTKNNFGTVLLNV